MQVSVLVTSVVLFNLMNKFQMCNEVDNFAVRCCYYKYPQYLIN
jgi:hypothetical protein